MLTEQFRVFLELWNINQRYITPSIHRRMAKWLATSLKNGDQQLLLMAFRGAGKSTIVALYVTFLLWVEPATRVLVLAADQSLANKMVRNIRKLIESHPLTTHLRPTKPDQWAADRFTINRDRELRDPSVLAAGITTNITGCRADIIIYDDVEVPNTCGTHEKRLSLRERLNESRFVLAAGGKQLFIGTPHSYFSIYAAKARKEINEERPYLDGFKRKEIPILNKLGGSNWPEQFSRKDIDQIKTQVGPQQFQSQMMLRPVNITESRLDTKLLQYYESELDPHEVMGVLHLSLNGKKIISCSSWWDPSYGGEKSDHSVFAVIFIDEAGHYYLHHISYIKTGNTGLDEATDQCQQVVNIVKKYFIPSISIETNGIGKFLPGILKNELAKENINCAVIEKTSSQSKQVRILEAFDVVLAAQALSVHDAVKNTPFIHEMIEWQPSNKNGFDDGLDAVAGALSLEPVRLKRFYATANKSWKGRSDTHQAKTDFDI